MANVLEVSKISEFYRNKEVFITGGTGFIGKVLVEKLLRCCSDVKRVYLLVRAKRGITPHDRVKQILECKLFDQVKDKQPHVLEKISCVVGCLESSNLGMSSEDYIAISTEVSVIIHNAANMKFSGKLRPSLIQNLLGTKHVIDLAKNCKNIQALVYVSTTFSNTHQENIYETVYPTEFSAKNIADCVSWMSDEMLEKLKPQLLSCHPNNYSYSKCLAEQLLIEEGGELPIVIARPSIVSSTYKEPYEGWTDGYNAQLYLAFAVSMGFLKTFFHPSKRNDIIPVDYCVNLILASAWHKSLQGKSGSCLTVYNCSTDTVNSAWKNENGSKIVAGHSRYPSIKFYRFPNVHVISNKVLYEIYNVIFHILPFLLYDAYLLITGNEPQMFQRYKKIRSVLADTEYYFSNDWYFHSENFKILLHEMSEKDKKIFDIDVRNINWERYHDIYSLGIHEHLFKEDFSTLQMARNRKNRWYYLDIGIWTLSIGILCVLPVSMWSIITGFY